ncbi:protein RMD5 homolog [Beta vulgaris subsp. vulgaris]|uniref:protein RMD5 homolog n=1 Tax=Beta vulgaris subsp. vulgaris TaxID=3555 RepID=UPI0020368629|nr:protein RMD5 homolog [Beta vulgaris subsp. vulgaris]XP_048492603.1 protein RMD5 homolog [Beta vulgaris subsp. vulgaris]
MELNTLKESFEHVVKKRKLSSSKCLEVVDTISQELEQALSKVQSDQDLETILKELKSKLDEYSPDKELESSQKELESNFSKYSKVLDKVSDPNISRKVDFDVQTINQIIADHFYCLGLFDIGDCLIEEAGIPEVNVLRSQFFEMYQIMEALRAENIQPALNWVTANHEKLKGNGLSFELKLHQVQFVDLLKQGNRTDVLSYARANLAPLSSSHMYEIQKLMASLLWIGKLEKYPYLQMLTPPNWEDLRDELSREFCVLLGRSCRSPLEMVVEAGSEIFPTLLRFMKVMRLKPCDWQTMDELPFPVDLDKDFQFHSTFICPVTRDEGSLENPPMLLPCGHVLCRLAIMKMSKNDTRNFKCPYCPVNTAVAQCRQLYI